VDSGALHVRDLRPALSRAFASEIAMWGILWLQARTPLEIDMRFALISSLALTIGCTPEPCTVPDNADGTFTLTCRDGTSATVLNGTNGNDGNEGLDAVSWLVDTEVVSSLLAPPVSRRSRTKTFLDTTYVQITLRDAIGLGVRKRRAPVSNALRREPSGTPQRAP